MCVCWNVFTASSILVGGDQQHYRVSLKVPSWWLADNAMPDVLYRMVVSHKRVQEWKLCVVPCIQCVNRSTSTLPMFLSSNWGPLMLQPILTFSVAFSWWHTASSISANFLLLSITWWHTSFPLLIFRVFDTIHYFSNWPDALCPYIHGGLWLDKLFKDRLKNVLH